jgi:hypothetical protein
MKTRIVSVRLSENAVVQADRLQKFYGISRSKLIEQLLENEIKDIERVNDEKWQRENARERKW